MSEDIIQVQSENEEEEISIITEEGESIISLNGETIMVNTSTYIHEQGIASDTWVINHKLGKFPSVTVVDSAGMVFDTSVQYNDENTCTVYINGATKGKAYLN